MRKFSDFEKKVLDLIIKLFNNNQTVCADVRVGRKSPFRVRQN